MDFSLLNYVALFFVFLFYFALKRWYRSLGGTNGRSSLKRLRRCASQVLIRAARRHLQFFFLETCYERRHWLQYSFCYYYGGHAANGSTWLMTAGTLYFLWNDMHAGSSAQCYALSIMMFSGIARPWFYGPWMGVALGVAMPAVMPCHICPPRHTAGDCEGFQRLHGCHACDRTGCWQKTLPLLGWPYGRILDWP
jgi:hypothetical protein